MTIYIQFNLGRSVGGSDFLVLSGLYKGREGCVSGTVHFVLCIVYCVLDITTPPPARPGVGRVSGRKAEGSGS